MLDHTIVQDSLNGVIGSHISARYSIVTSNEGNGLSDAPVGMPDANGNLVGSSSHGFIYAGLGPMVYNGGPVYLDGSRLLTHALLPESLAIYVGDPSAVAGAGDVPEFDERGASFKRVYGGRIDIGAVEYQPNSLPGDYNFDGGVDAADYTVWRDTLASTTDLRADGDASGSVDAGDYSFWKSRFGNLLSASGAGNGAAAALAEPVVLGLRQVEGGVRSTIFDIAPAGPAAWPGIDRPLPADELSAAVAGQDLLLEAWSVTRIGEHRMHDDWANDLPFHKAEAEEPPSDVASAVDSAFALLGAIAEQ